MSADASVDVIAVEGVVPLARKRRPVIESSEPNVTVAAGGAGATIATAATDTGSVVDLSVEEDIEVLKKEIMRLRLENEALKSKKCEVYSPDTPLGVLQELAEKIYKGESDACAWKGSLFEYLDMLKSDCSGKAGELLIEKFCNLGEIPNIYTGDVNSTDGTYDIIIKGKKVEIKTAKLGKQKGFQHEGLRISGYDYLLFLDVCPSYYYITVMPKFDLTVKSEILGRKAHLRKGTSDVFKLDFNEKILNSLVSKDVTLKVTDATSMTDVISFISSKIV
jgi:hypothetical protein